MSLDSRFFTLISIGDIVGVYNMMKSKEETTSNDHTPTTEIAQSTTNILLNNSEAMLNSLQLASRYGYVEIFKLLLNKWSSSFYSTRENRQDKENELTDSLYLACEMNHLEIVELILPCMTRSCVKNFGGRYGEFIVPVMKAIENGNIAIVKVYFEKFKFSVNESCYCIPSRYRYDCEKYPLWVAVENGNLSMARFLLDIGASVDQLNGEKEDETALEKACGLEDEDMIELLLKYGASSQRILEREENCLVSEILLRVVEKLERKEMEFSRRMKLNHSHADVSIITQCDFI